MDTIYFGGGTPSTVPAEALSHLLDIIRSAFAIESDAEITVEVNPESVTIEKFSHYRENGINRVSIGVQSFNDGNLRLLERRHTAADAHRACNDARRAGFDNLSLDLIYGLPGQHAADWGQDLETAVALGPEHLSCYSLTFEPCTVFDHRRKKGRLRPLAEEKVAALFLLTSRQLGDSGYVQYEISNFARRQASGNRLPLSRHNSKYWTLAPYLGFGPAAHSFDGRSRWWNVSSLKRYIREIKAGRPALAASEKLSPKQRMTESLYLGLRTCWGIHIDDFNRRFHTDFEELFDGTLKRLREKGLLELQSGRCLLTRRGMLLLDALVEELILNY